jgi:hypothetical protein
MFYQLLACLGVVGLELSVAAYIGSVLHMKLGDLLLPVARFVDLATSAALVLFFVLPSNGADPLLVRVVGDITGCSFHWVMWWLSLSS